MQNPPGGKPGGFFMSAINPDVEQSLGIHICFTLEMCSFAVGIT